MSWILKKAKDQSARAVRELERERQTRHLEWEPTYQPRAPRPPQTVGRLPGGVTPASPGRPATSAPICSGLRWPLTAPPSEGLGQPVSCCQEQGEGLHSCEFRLSEGEADAGQHGPPTEGWWEMRGPMAFCEGGRGQGHSRALVHGVLQPRPPTPRGALCVVDAPSLGLRKDKGFPQRRLHKPERRPPTPSTYGLEGL